MQTKVVSNKCYTSRAQPSAADKYFNLIYPYYVCIEAFKCARRSTVNLIHVLILEKRQSLELLVSRFGMDDMQIGVNIFCFIFFYLHLYGIKWLGCTTHIVCCFTVTVLYQNGGINWYCFSFFIKFIFKIRQGIINIS